MSRYSDRFLAAAAAAALCLAPFTAGAQLTRVANTTLNLPQTLPNSTGYTTVNAFGGLTFNKPVCVKNAPGVTNAVFVVEQSGTIQRVNLATNAKSVFLNVADFLDNTASSTPPGPNTPLLESYESGLLGLAFHPDYVNNGYFYITFTRRNSPGSGTIYWTLARFRASGSPPYTAATTADPTTYTKFISQLDQQDNHNGGDLAFGPLDGYLYVSTGDEGGGNDSWANSRRIDRDYFAAILRIDVDRKTANQEPQTHTAIDLDGASKAYYKVPADNPFIGLTQWDGKTISPGNIRTEIWATGLRNPWRMSFDPPTNRLFVSDVGQGAREEVDIIVAGGDYGWYYWEGNLDRNRGDEPTGYNYETTPVMPGGLPPRKPIHDYNRDIGSCVTGGYVYRGTRLTELTGKYIFADFLSNKVWALTEDEEDGTWTRTDLLDVAAVSGFGVDPRNGDRLHLNNGALPGEIDKLERVTDDPGSEPPATLSGTGAFSNTATLTPNAGIVAYEPNVPFWSDHALKTRWFSIPNVSSDMTWSKDENWTFPAGQVWIKHFEIETIRGNPASARRLETRFIVKNAAGAYGLTYKWRSDGLDADLVGAEGLDETLTIQVAGNPVQQTWRYPSRGQCMQCHTSAAGYALSFTTRQMNRDHVYGAQTLNQLAALSGAGYFTAPVTGIHNLPALAAPDDETKSLEWRARSYLAANCAQCHQPGGGPTTNFDLRDHRTTAQTNLINGTLNQQGNNPGYRLVIPGNPELSMVLDRIRSNNPASSLGRMPPVARNAVDPVGTALIEEWIAEDLENRQTFAQWYEARFGVPPVTGDEADDPDGDGADNELEFLARTDPEIAEPPPLPDVFANPATGQLSVGYERVYNRALLIESSPDLTTWQPWDVPGNQPEIAAEGQEPKIITIPLPTGDGLYFRLQYTEL